MKIVGYSEINSKYYPIYLNFILNWIRGYISGSTDLLLEYNLLIYNGQDELKPWQKNYRTIWKKDFPAFWIKSGEKALEFIEQLYKENLKTYKDWEDERKFLKLSKEIPPFIPYKQYRNLKYS